MKLNIIDSSSAASGNRKPPSGGIGKHISIGIIISYVGQMLWYLWIMLSVRSRRSAYLCGAIPSISYSAYLFSCRMAGIPGGVIDRAVASKFSEIFSTIDAVYSATNINGDLKDIFVSQIVVDGIASLCLMPIIMIIVYLKRKKLSMYGAVSFLPVATMLMVNFGFWGLLYDGGIRHNSISPKLYSNTDICILNIGAYHGISMIVYSIFAIGFVRFFMKR